MAAMVMPGSLLVDTPTLPPKLDVNVGAKSHIFQPPKSSSASDLLHQSHSAATLHCQRSDRASIMSKRKRSQRDSGGAVTENTGTAPDSGPAWSHLPPCNSPEPLANSQYRLSGGLDTPTGLARAHDDGGHNDPASIFSSPSYRRSRPTDASEPYDYFSSEKPTHPLSRERNGHARIPETSPKFKDGVGRAIYSVAGTVWKFCRENTGFNGFFAGGGQGYALQESSKGARDGEQYSWQETDEKHPSSGWTIYEDEDDDSMTSRPIPGCFPEEDYIPDYMSRNHQESTSPPAKRIHHGDGDGDEKTETASWMLISHNSSGNGHAKGRQSPTVSRASSPCKFDRTQASPFSSSTAGNRRSPSRHRASRPSLASSRPYTSASSAAYMRHRHSTSASSGILPSPKELRRSHTDTLSGGGGGGGGGASYASPRSPSKMTTNDVGDDTNNTTPSRRNRRSHHPTDPTAPPDTPHSPLKEDLQRHAARLRRREVEEDANLQRFNRQLKAMIREGKEALGTKVEVEVFEDG